MEIVNLYGESDGMAIYLDQELSVLPDHMRHMATTKVIGHHLYCCSADDAELKILRAYYEHKGIPDPSREILQQS